MSVDKARGTRSPQLQAKGIHEPQGIGKNAKTWVKRVSSTGGHGGFRLKQRFTRLRLPSNTHLKGGEGAMLGRLSVVCRWEMEQRHNEPEPKVLSERL
jgi:hypothetical protein